MSKTGRPTKKMLNPFIVNWLKENNFDNLNQAGVARGIAPQTLQSLADMEKTHQIFAQILELSEKMGLDPKTLMEGVLEGKTREPVERKIAS